MKKVSDVFKSIRFAKNVPGHDKGPATSTDDEEHGAVSSQEFAQQLAHVKKRAMQEEKKMEGKDPCWTGYEMVGMKDKNGKKVPNCVPVSEDKEVELTEGRPSQRHPLEGHEYHRKSDEALIHIAKDAHAAAEAMKSHNTAAENKYRDQANDSDRKSTRLNSSHTDISRMPSSA